MPVHWDDSEASANAALVVSLLRPEVLEELAAAAAAAAAVVELEIEVEVVSGAGVGAGIVPQGMPLSVSCVEQGLHLDPWAHSCEAFSSSSRALAQLHLLPLA